MKGSISLKDFISQVSDELRNAQSKNNDEAFFELKEVTLEVSFALDTTAKGSGKFVVMDVSGETKASQIHRVTLKLDPLKKRPEGMPLSPEQYPVYSYPPPNTGPLFPPGNPWGNPTPNHKPNFDLGPQPFEPFDPSKGNR